MVVGARQSFQLFRQITWFFRNNRALSKFWYRILYYLISSIKSQKSVRKSQFYINHASHLSNSKKCNYQKMSKLLTRENLFPIY